MNFSTHFLSFLRPSVYPIMWTVKGKMTCVVSICMCFQFAVLWALRATVENAPKTLLSYRTSTFKSRKCFHNLKHHLQMSIWHRSIRVSTFLLFIVEKVFCSRWETSFSTEKNHMATQSHVATKHDVSCNLILITTVVSYPFTRGFRLLYWCVLMSSLVPSGAERLEHVGP